MSISPNANKWLDLISYAEGTYDPSAGGRQYNIMFGGGRFSDLSQHPDKVINSGRYSSAAAGAYQFMPATWASTGGGSMAPERQDLAALELIRRRGVDPDVDPITPQTVSKLAPEWASLPTTEGKSYYGQPVRSFGELAKFADVTPTTQSSVTNRQTIPTRRGQVAEGQGAEAENQDIAALMQLLNSRTGIEGSSSYLGDPVIPDESDEDLKGVLRKYIDQESASEKQLPVERTLPRTMLDSTVDGIQQLAKQAMNSFTPGKSVF